MLLLSFIFYFLIVLQTINFIIFITKILQGVEISVSSRVAGLRRSGINYLLWSVNGALPQLDFTYAAYNNGDKLNAR